MARRRRSRKTNWKWLAFFPVLTMLVLLSQCGHSEKPKETPQNVETMVMLLMSQTPTATITPIPTDTPVPTATPTPTDTPVPTNTPTETVEWLPAVMEPSAETYYYPDGSSWTPGNVDPVYTENGTSYYADGSSWTPDNSVSDTSCHDISCGCRIWGNVNKTKGTKIYHCPNDPNYYPENFKASQGDRWFCTEAEATAAGFRPPKNAPACGGF